MPTTEPPADQPADPVQIRPAAPAAPRDRQGREVFTVHPQIRSELSDFRRTGRAAQPPAGGDR